MKPQCTDTKTLQICVSNIDGIAQEGLRNIAALANIAASALGSTSPDLATVIRLISRDAEDLLNTINGEACTVGCAYSDEADEDPEA